MIKIIFMLTVLVLAQGSASADSLGSDFKNVCEVVEEALSLDATSEVMAKYVRDNLHYRIESEEVIQAYEAIFLVDPAERYKLFQEIAEDNMEEPWDCPAFKVFVE